MTTQLLNNTTTTTSITTTSKHLVEVDVIIPVHNAASTIEDAVQSATYQVVPLKRYNEEKEQEDNDEDTCKLNKFQSILDKYNIVVTVCCYNDGSTDESWDILQHLEKKYNNELTADTTSISELNQTLEEIRLPTRLLIKSSSNGIACGAGYARNRAIEMNNNPISHLNNNNKNRKFLCLLDSDDIMHKYRIIEQTTYMLSLEDSSQQNTILGCNFQRQPKDATWHYSHWANTLTDERIILEQYREITIIQPTWFMSYNVWLKVGGYIEGPSPNDNNETTAADIIKERKTKLPSSSSCSDPLIHPKYDTLDTIRLAEDLRFFYTHLQTDGNLKLHKTKIPLVIYRHTHNSQQSQSYRTSRKLLLQLRVLAFTQSILLRNNVIWQQFIIWGAGRDGKDFFKTLDPEIQQKVYCFVDVDNKKLKNGYYVHDTTRNSSKDNEHRNDTKDNCHNVSSSTLKVPIIHFSFLIKDQELKRRIQYEWENNSTESTSDKIFVGRIDKTKPSSLGKKINVSDDDNNNHTSNVFKTTKPVKKKQKLQDCGHTLHIRGLDPEMLQTLPVVVCVAMYRTNGVLERNVKCIERTEGKDLWHFS